MISLRDLRRIVFAAAVSCPLPAYAHSPIEGFGTFYSHLLHPVQAPAQGLLLISSSLLLGQQGRLPARRGTVVFMMAFIVGLTGATIARFEIIAEPMLILAALVIGTVVSLEWRIHPAITSTVAAYSGLIVGLDTIPATSGLRDTALATAGVTTGVAYLAIVTAGSLVTIKKSWQRIGIRIAGSWIAAICVLMLALSVAGPVHRAAASVG